jgi:hypothetical protein
MRNGKGPIGVLPPRTTRVVVVVDVPRLGGWADLRTRLLRAQKFGRQKFNLRPTGSPG